MPPSNSSKKRRLSETGDIAEAVLAATEKPTADAEAPPRKKQSQRRSLFVRSLPASATTESLIAHFSESFPIKHASVVTDRETKQCKGFGFITFTDAEDAERALKEFNGSKFDGKKIKIEIAEPRKRDVEDAIPGAVAAGEGKPRSQPSAERVAAKVQREEDKKEAAKAPKLIIRNLPWSIKKPEQLAKLFVKYGKVKLATLPQSKPGLLKGFGFVVLRGKPNAEKAMAEVNGMEVDGRTLAVDWAVEKEVWKEQAGENEDVVMKEEEEEEEDEDTKISGVGVMSDEDDMDDEAGDGSDEDEVDAEDESDVDMGDEDDLEADAPPPESTTLFVRNVPFDCDDDILKEHFTHFGPIRYARVVIDPNTERPRGTAFVCFFNAADAQSCLRNAPRASTAAAQSSTSRTTGPSVLQNPELDDPEGHYTLLGRLLSLSLAVSRNDAARLTTEGQERRDTRDKDKRRLYLLSEGTVSASSPLHSVLSAKELDMRSASAKQRQQIIRSNPSLHLSLTRLSVRNIPRSITSKDLKALAREAVVGFAKDVKDGKRTKLSREELVRGGEEMLAAEKGRKKAGKGIVKQAKVVFEGREGKKVNEAEGAGRSRGYGFIEYYTHRAALMGLRWMNGHAVGYKVEAEKSKKGKGRGRQTQEQVREEMEDRKKRLIVEFAIENAQVVHRRFEREKKSREAPVAGAQDGKGKDGNGAGDARNGKDGRAGKNERGGKDKKDRKGPKGKGNINKGPREKTTESATAAKKEPAKDATTIVDGMTVQHRNQIIARKMNMRRKGRKGGA